MITRESAKTKDIIKALTSPINLCIVLLLKEQGELSTKQICTQLAKRRNLISAKLSWLTYLGVLTRRDEGRVAYYSLRLDSRPVTNLVALISQKIEITGGYDEWLGDGQQQHYHSLLASVRQDLIRQAD